MRFVRVTKAAYAHIQQEQTALQMTPNVPSHVVKLEVHIHSYVQPLQGTEQILRVVLLSECS